eukprot:Nk52_evm16s2039 gene=Nk52_evmTU16s2039
MVKTVTEKGVLDLELKGLSRLGPTGTLSKIYSHNGYRWYMSVVPKEKVVYLNSSKDAKSGNTGGGNENGGKRQRKSYFDTLSVYLHLKDAGSFSNGVKCRVSYALSVSSANGGKSKPALDDGVLGGDSDEGRPSTIEKKFEAIFRNDSTRCPKEKSLTISLKELKNMNIKDLRTSKLIFRLKILSLTTFFDWELKGLAKQLKDSMSTQGSVSAMNISMQRSPEFMYRDYKLCMEVLPGGGSIVNHTTLTMSNPNHISINLCNADSGAFSPGVQCQLQFSLIIVDQKQNSNSLEKRGEALYSCSKTSHGFPKFVTIEEILKNPKGYLKGGTLIIRCMLRQLDVFYDWSIKNFSRQMNSTSIAAGGEGTTGGTSGSSSFNIHSIGGIGCFFQSQIFEHCGQQWMVTLEQASSGGGKEKGSSMGVYLHSLEASTLTSVEAKSEQFNIIQSSNADNLLTTKCSALIAFSVIDQTDAGRSVEKQVPIRFSPENRKVGISKFLNLNELKKAGKALIKADKVIIRVKFLRLSKKVDWEVRQFSKLGYSGISSPFFPYGGFHWVFSMYPKGDPSNIQNTADHISFYVSLQEAAEFPVGMKCRAIFAVCLIDQDEEARDIEVLMECVYQHDRHINGLSKFVPLREVIESKFIRSGALRFDKAIFRLRLVSLETTFDWSIPDFPKLEGSKISDVFSYGGYRWYVTLQNKCPKVNDKPSFKDGVINLNLSLQEAASFVSSLRCICEFSLIIVNQVDPFKNIEKGMEDELSLEYPYSGFKEFTTVDELYRMQKGFLKNNELKLRVRMKFVTTFFDYEVSRFSKSIEEAHPHMSVPFSYGGFHWIAKVITNDISHHTKKRYLSAYLLMQEAEKQSYSASVVPTDSNDAKASGGADHMKPSTNAEDFYHCIFTVTVIDQLRPADCVEKTMECIFGPDSISAGFARFLSLEDVIGGGGSVMKKGKGNSLTAFKSSISGMVFNDKLIVRYKMLSLQSINPKKIRKLLNTPMVKNQNTNMLGRIKDKLISSAITASVFGEKSERPRLPGKVTRFKLLNRTYASLSLSWSPPSGNGTDIVKYELQYKPKGGFDTSDVAEVENEDDGWRIVDKAIQSPFHDVNYLKANTKYCFRIRAANGVGWGEYSNTVKCRTSVEPYLESTFKDKECPANWSSGHCDRRVGSAQLFEVQTDEGIFQMIQYLMNTTIVPHPPVRGGVFNRLKVVKVERNQNMHLWQVYAANRNAIQERLKMDVGSENGMSIPLGIPMPCLDGLSQEFFLFHGSCSRNTDAIIVQGLDNRVTSEHGKMFGKGIYFAENSSKSNQYADCSFCGYDNCNGCVDGVFVMFLCRVVLGEPYITSQKIVNLERPPPKPSGGYGLYDSVFGESQEHIPDSALKYREFVVYNQFQVYPEYIIYYKRVCV